MANEPAAKPTFVVLKYKRPHWHTVLATVDKGEAEAMLKLIAKAKLMVGDTRGYSRRKEQTVWFCY